MAGSVLGMVTHSFVRIVCVERLRNCGETGKGVYTKRTCMYSVFILRLIGKMMKLLA